MNLLKLKVVIWKNFVIRKRHWLLTAFESLLPVTIFFLIAYARSKIKGLNKTEVPYPTYNEPTLITYDTLSTSHLLYVPNNHFYENLIHEVLVKFELPNDGKLFDKFWLNYVNQIEILTFKNNS